MNKLNSLIKQVAIPTIKRKNLLQTTKRFTSNIADESRRQSVLFDEEARRQKELVGRIEKIEVQYEGVPENCVLTMNSQVSTPYDCARHMGNTVTRRAAIALLNGETLWHMHKPLPASCKLELLHYQIPNPAAVNKAFWRTCSFVLGAVATQAFKDEIPIKLHSFPSPNVKSGSFVYDIELPLDNWQPTQSELKVLSIEMIKFCQQNHKIECLDVDKEFAFKLFTNNPHKTEQIPSIAAHNGDKVSLFKVGEHIDISKGPMVPNTRHFGRITVTNVIKLETEIPNAKIYRFQGVALPSSIVLNHYAYSLIEERGRTLNSARIPGSHDAFNDDNSFVAQVTV